MNKLIYGNKKGFSLIELIVVIAIIGILVMMAAPRFLGFTKKAEVARMQNNIKVITDAAEMYHIDHGDWPRATDIPYTRDDLKDYTDGYFAITGEKPDLDEGGNFYNIDWEKLKPYVKQPEDGFQYILQNPVGKVFYVKINNLETKSIFKEFTETHTKLSILTDMYHKYLKDNEVTHAELILDGFLVTLDSELIPEGNLSYENRFIIESTGNEDEEETPHL